MCGRAGHTVLYIDIEQRDVRIGEVHLRRIIIMSIVIVILILLPRVVMTSRRGHETVAWAKAKVVVGTAACCAVKVDRAVDIVYLWLLTDV